MQKRQKQKNDAENTMETKQNNDEVIEYKSLTWLPSIIIIILTKIR